MPRKTKNCNELSCFILRCSTIEKQTAKKISKEKKPIHVNMEKKNRNIERIRNNDTKKICISV